MKEQRQTGRFLKILGRREVLALAFGAMIGWSWVVLTGTWISSAGVLGSIVAFLVGGAGIALIGLTYAELASAPGVAHRNPMDCARSDPIRGRAPTSKANAQLGAGLRNGVPRRRGSFGNEITKGPTRASLNNPPGTNSWERDPLDSNPVAICRRRAGIVTGNLRRRRSGSYRRSRASIRKLRPRFSSRRSIARSRVGPRFGSSVSKTDSRNTSRSASSIGMPAERA